MVWCYTHDVEVLLVVHRTETGSYVCEVVNKIDHVVVQRIRAARSS